MSNFRDLVLGNDLLDMASKAHVAKEIENFCNLIVPMRK